MSPPDRRFDGDIMPDATWGICKVHSPAAPVRLVNERGEITEGGICQMCHAEMNSDKYFGCPIHGLNEKAPGKSGCPVPGCLGEDPGPTEAEIAREAESLSRVWPGGPPRPENAVDETPARPESERDREARPRPRDETRETPRPDVQGGPGPPRLAPRTWPSPDDKYVIHIDPAVKPDGTWKDPFLIEEP